MALIFSGQPELQRTLSLRAFEAIKVICEHTRGIPRRINNNVCSSCLLLAFRRGESLIDDGLVLQVMMTEYAPPV